MKSSTIHSTLPAAALAGLLLATGCAAPQEGPPPAAATPATSAAEPTATAAAVIETFTFPDGHISSTHPAGWTVRTKPGPALNKEAQKTSYDATVFDASGAEVAHVLSGMYGDGAAGPVERTIPRIPAGPDRLGNQPGAASQRHHDGSGRLWRISVHASLRSARRSESLAGIRALRATEGDAPQPALLVM